MMTSSELQAIYDDAQQAALLTPQYDDHVAGLVAVERAARAQVWREAAEVCDGFDVCDPQHIAREFRARAEKEQG